jgi:hypothetical protein
VFLRDYWGVEYPSFVSLPETPTPLAGFFLDKFLVRLVGYSFVGGVAALDMAKIGSAL